MATVAILDHVCPLLAALATFAQSTCDCFWQLSDSEWQRWFILAHCPLPLFLTCTFLVPWALPTGCGSQQQPKAAPGVQSASSRGGGQSIRGGPCGHGRLRPLANGSPPLCRPATYGQRCGRPPSPAPRASLSPYMSPVSSSSLPPVPSKPPLCLTSHSRVPTPPNGGAHFNSSP